MNELVGKTLGRYLILSVLGEGGMGTVFKGQDPTLQRVIALKVMHPNLARQPGFAERFLQEARAAARLDHRSIVKIHEFSQSGDLLFIAEEYLHGENLRQLLHGLRSDGQWLSLAEAVEITRQVALALDYAHRQGVLHRDIKPDNIMLKAEPTDGLPLLPVVTDFGLAKLLEGGGFQTEHGTSLGTPAYMSPEQALGQAVDARSDVYSLGIMLYELAVGRLPFPVKTLSEAIRVHPTQPPPPPRSLRPELPASLEGIILRALAKDPAARYPTAAAFAQALGAVTSEATQVNTAPATLAVSSLATRYQTSLLTPRGPSVMAGLPTPPGIGKDRLVIRGPDGTQRTISIETAELIVGRSDKANVVLDDSKVSRHHTKITFDGAKYHVLDLGSTNGTLMANAKLLAGIAQEWTPEKPLRIGDHWVYLQRGERAAKTVFRSDGTIVDAALLQTSANQQLAVFMEPIRLAVEAGGSVVATLSVLNLGTFVDHFLMTVAGVPAAWLPAAPPSTQLMPGEQKAVSFALQPPRSPQSRAGEYPLAVRIASERDPSQVVELKATLVVGPYRQFLSQLKPEKLKTGASGRLELQNQGNSDETFAIAWSDRADELVFKPAQTQVTVAAGQQAATTYTARPRKRRWIGGQKQHPFVAQVAPAQGLPQIPPQAPQGEIVSSGLLPPWLPPILIFLCVALAAAAALGLKGQIDGGQQATATVIAATATAQDVAGKNSVALTATATWKLGDDDRDGLTNQREIELGTLSDNRDTDADELSDGAEVNERDTDPLRDDTDGDGWKDGFELQRGTDPLKVDTDGDKTPDPQDLDPGHASTPTSTPTKTWTPKPIPTRTATATPKPAGGSGSPAKLDNSVFQVEFGPEPTVLSTGDSVSVRFGYSTSESAGVNIVVTPYTGASPSPNGSGSRSSLSEATGTGDGSFSIQSGTGTVDAVLIQMFDRNGSLLFETLISGPEYVFTEPTPTPTSEPPTEVPVTPTISTETPVTPTLLEEPTVPSELPLLRHITLGSGATSASIAFQRVLGQPQAIIPRAMARQTMHLALINLVRPASKPKGNRSPVIPAFAGMTGERLHRK